MASDGSKKRKLPFQLTRQSAVASSIAECRALLDAVERGEEAVKKTKFTDQIIDALVEHTVNANPWLGMPIDIVKKILLYLPPKECWRIGGGLNKEIRKWVLGEALHVYQLVITNVNPSKLKQRVFNVYCCMFRGKESDNGLLFCKSLVNLEFKQFRQRYIRMHIYKPLSDGKRLQVCYFGKKQSQCANIIFTSKSGKLKRFKCDAKEHDIFFSLLVLWPKIKKK